MTVIQLFLHYLLQIAVTVGVIVFTGLSVMGAKHVFLKSCRGGAYYVELVTGLIGTPVHELSHAFFCVLFGHRIKRICLWTPHPENGNIGYVTHTYKRRNLWHQIGNFFIGIAPIIGGGAVLLLLLYLLLPESATIAFSGGYDRPDALLEMLREVPLQALSVLKALFLPSNFRRFHFYLYLFLAVFIVLHMEISGSDLRSGIWGFLFISVILLLLDLGLFFFYPTGLTAVTECAIVIGGFLSAFLCLSVVLSLLLLLVSFVVFITRRT